MKGPHLKWCHPGAYEERNAYILSLRELGWTAAKIAKEMDLSVQRVRQILRGVTVQ